MGNGQAVFNYGDNIISGPEITKEKKESTFFGTYEVWGQYKKILSPPILGIGEPTFQPPKTVDSVPILCKCREIPEFMQDNNTVWTRILSKTLPHPPACWEDKYTIWNFSGGDTYEVHINDPGFTAYSLSNMGAIGILDNLSGVSVLGLPLPVWGAAYGIKRIANGKIGGRVRKARKARKKTRRRSS
jgi:hypothetical protein